MGKRGPRPKGEYADKSAVLSTRISAELREHLEDAVKASGLTLSREIERRLRRTFQEDHDVEEGFGTRRNRALMKIVAMAIKLAFNPARPDADWIDDPITFEIIVRMINNVLEAIRPAPAPPLDAFAKLETLDTPARLWRGIQQADSSLPFNTPWRQALVNQIKADLGDVADRPQIFEGDAADHRRRLKDMPKSKTRKGKKK